MSSDKMAAVGNGAFCQIWTVVVVVVVKFQINEPEIDHNDIVILYELGYVYF